MTNETKYTAIAKELSRDIFTSRFGKRLPNNVDLAKLYKATPTTIRKSLRLLQESGTVEVKTTRGGTIISEEALSRRKHRAIALICTDVHKSIENIYFQKLIVSIQEYLENNGSYRLQIENTALDEKGEGKSPERVRDMFQLGFYDGVLAMNIFSEDQIIGLMRDKIPLVMIGSTYTCDVPSVKHDDAAMASEIIAEVERVGASCVALLGKTPSHGKRPGAESSVGRLIQWLSERNFIDDERIRFIDFGNEHESAEKHAQGLAEKYPGIDLFITYGSNISRGAYAALRTLPLFAAGKIRLLPITDEDVIGAFPNLLLAVREIGRTAAEILVEMIEGRNHETAPRHLLKPYWRGRSTSS